MGGGERVGGGGRVKGVGAERISLFPPLFFLRYPMKYILIRIFNTRPWGIEVYVIGCCTVDMVKELPALMDIRRWVRLGTKRWLLGCSCHGKHHDPVEH